MTAVLRIGAEVKAGYQQQAAITGSYDPLRVTVVEPGRTGGAMYRCARPTEFSSLGVRVGGWPTDSMWDRIPQADDGQLVIGRAYVKVNQYPVAASAGDAPPGHQRGVPVMFLGPETFGVLLGEDGRLAACGNPSDFYGTIADRDIGPIPLNEWVMLEVVTCWSLTGLRAAIIRATLPGEDPAVIYCRSSLGSSSLDPAVFDDHGDAWLPGRTPRITAGIFEIDPGVGYVIDVDDLGINLADDGPNSTWCGPGAVRAARPSADVAADPGFEPGSPDGTSRAIEGRTRADHGTNSVFVGSPLEICPGNDFWSTLANNPPLNPATAPAGRCGRQGYEVSSTGSDYHEHRSSPPPPTLPTNAWVYVYDWPRVSSAGDTLVVECDATDREDESFSFATSFVVGTQTEKASGGATDGSRGYMAFFADFDGTAPTPLDEADRAVQNLERDWPDTGSTDSEWMNTTGRVAQAPTVSDAPQLTFRREDATTAVGEGSTEVAHIGEFKLIGAGIIYESGYVPQPPVAPCRRLMAWV
jgi:hypothetical protein